MSKLLSLRKTDPFANSLFKYFTNEHKLEIDTETLNKENSVILKIILDSRSTITFTDFKFIKHESMRDDIRFDITIRNQTPKDMHEITDMRIVKKISLEFCQIKRIVSTPIDNPMTNISFDKCEPVLNLKAIYNRRSVTILKKQPEQMTYN